MLTKQKTCFSHLAGMLLIALLAGCVKSLPVNEIIACGDDTVMIINLDASDEDSVAIVWQWRASDAASQLPEEYQRYLRTTDECKPVNGNTQILVTSSSGAVVLIDRNTKQCLFYAYVPNAHSADLLPGGRVAVALSVSPKGNSIQLYDINKSDHILFRDSLYSGHGAVWMAERERFYALGFDELREYSLKDWHSQTPSLVLEKTWKIPVEGGHDLTRISADELLVSGHEGVDMFDARIGRFTPFEPLHKTENVKSVNYNKKTGRLVYTKADENWWTFHIRIENPDKKLHIPDVRLYKVRVINAE